MNQKIANNMYKFTLYNIYTLIRGKNTNIQVVELGKSHGLWAVFLRNLATGITPVHDT